VTPARSQPVVIRLPDAPDLPARVDAADAASVTLVLAVAPADRVDATTAVVEYLSPTGIHRIQGALAPATGDPAVLRLARHGEEVVQRRDWARVDAVVPVDVGPAATVTRNLSGGGALIHDPIGVPVGTRVRLRLHLDGAAITAAGVVMRETTDGARGIALTDIADGDRERLVRFVTERQRAALRLRRDA
jgi:PilZ domain